MPQMLSDITKSWWIVILDENQLKFEYFSPTQVSQFWFENEKKKNI